MMRVRSMTCRALSLRRTVLVLPPGARRAAARHTARRGAARNSPRPGAQCDAPRRAAPYGAARRGAPLQRALRDGAGAAQHGKTGIIITIINIVII